MDRTLSECRNKFIWLGGNGWVHKGLNVCVEAFAKMENAELYICCHDEGNFLKKYKKEMELPNIHYVGYVDVNSEKFRALVNQCAFTIGASCSEGSCTSIITCMQTGLIPITSIENDIDYGKKFKDCKVETIRAAVEAVLSETSDAQMMEMIQASYQYTVDHTGQKLFYDLFHKAMKQILENKK